MTSTLHKLLRAGLLRCDDEVSFLFKGHTFAAHVTEGGLLSHCTWNGDAVLQDKVAFSTLTDWCDTCIQELLDEYVTRFSSWKRVRHVPTGMPLAQIRTQLKEAPAGQQQCRCAELRKQVLQLQMELQELQATKKRKAPDALQDDNPFRLKF